LRTDVDGTIEIRSDGKNWEAASQTRTARAPPDRPPLKQLDGLVNLNTASATELESLPGIGPALARRIIVGRPYRSVDDLLRIKGIGEHRFAEIRQHVTVR
jgi:competence ComEA-like helix-hairpin-helix protein